MAGDASWASVSVLLHGDGANNSTAVVDSATAPGVWTASGNAQISTAWSKFGSGAWLFDGNGDFLSGPTGTKYDLVSGDLTVEGWIKHNNPTDTVGSSVACVGNSTGYWQLIIRNGQLNVNALQAGNNYNLTANQTLDTAAHHFAWTRQAGTNRLFWDGALLTVTGSCPISATGNTNIYIGANFNGGTTSLNGYLDEIRLTKGVARYTAAFTPSTTPFPDGIGQVSGTVLNASNAPCARTVRGYRRDTGALVGSAVSDASTGAYSFYTPTLDELTVIALDDQTSGTYYDDQAIRVIPA